MAPEALLCLEFAPFGRVIGTGNHVDAIEYGDGVAVFDFLVIAMQSSTILRCFLEQGDRD